MVNKINSNDTGCFIAEEVAGSPKTLPGTPVWYEMEPNQYNDFGGKLKSVAREPINATRQIKRGTITDLDAAGGFNIDVTQDNLTRVMQGFFFADVHEKADTNSILSAGIPFTSATSTTYVAASGLGIFKANDLVFASGFTNSGNNGLKLLSAATGTTLTTTGNTAEASPPAAANVEAVGVQFASADATMTVTGGQATLGTTAYDLTTLGLNVGEWVFIGGDLTAEKFATCPVGYARIKTIAAHAILFDKVTAPFVTDAGTGKTIRMFFGKFQRNESTAALIKTRTYNVERQLGNDGVGIQSEYLEGAIANEFKLNLPSGDKLNADLSFLAMDNTQRSGTTGIKTGTRVAALGQDPYNTSKNVYRYFMSIITPGTLQPSALFGYITQGDISINNNAALAKAVGVLGAFDVSVGNFQVSGTVTAYFATVAATQAVRNNSDVTIDMILAKNNAGIIYDLPMVGLGDGGVKVEKDQAITVSLETLAAAGAANYTLGMVNFTYLPTSAMPT